MVGILIWILNPYDAIQFQGLVLSYAAYVTIHLGVHPDILLEGRRDDRVEDRRDDLLEGRRESRRALDGRRDDLLEGRRDDRLDGRRDDLFRPSSRRPL